MPNRLPPVADRVFRALLRLYPQKFREAYGDAMAQVFRDSRRAARRQSGWVGVATLWAHTLFDLTTTAAAERLSEERSLTMDKFFEALRAVLRKSIKVALSLILLVTVLLTVWVIRGKVAFAAEEQAVKEMWLQTTGTPLESIADNYPKAEPNAAATRLEEMMAGLGITEKDAVSLSLQGFNYRDYLDPECAHNRSDAIAPLPDVLEYWLAERGDSLSQLYTLVLQNELPRWQSEQAVWQTTFAKLSMLRHLQNLIALDVLSKTRRARHSDALKAYAASWRLNAALSERHEDIWRMTATAIATRQAVLLRKMQHVPAQWQARAVENNHQKLLLARLPLEASHSYKVISASATPAASFIRDYAYIPFVDVVDRLKLPDYYKKTRSLVYVKSPYVLLRATQKYAATNFDALCSLADYVTLENEIQQAYDGGRYSLQSWQRALHADLQLALTREVLRRKQSGQPPAPLPPESPCASHNWVTEKRQDGGVTIKLKDAPQWAQDVEFHLRAADHVVVR